MSIWTQRYNTNEMIRQVRRITSTPNSSTTTTTDDDILRYMEWCMRSVVVPSILKTRQEYFVVKQDIEVDPDKSYIELFPETLGLRFRELS